jgi:hypothetical protein
VVTAAARPHVFWVGDDPATRELVRGWPVGPALLNVLGDASPDVRDALARERARLRSLGYPEDLPQPALWWIPPPPPSDEVVEEADADPDTAQPDGPHYRGYRLTAA